MHILKFIANFFQKNVQFTIFLLLLTVSIIFAVFVHPQETEITPKPVEPEIYITDCDTQSVYAGRFDEKPVVKKSKSKYLRNGAPRYRTWVTEDEWRGRHCKTSKQRKEFRKWKHHQIDSFIEYMSFAAVVESKVFPDIPPELIVAQSILESNFGKSRLASDANNFFGHKYNGSNKHLFVVAADDSPYDRFTKYRSLWFSLRGHSTLLMRRYRKRIKGEPTLTKWLYALCGGITVEQSKRWRARGNSVYATSCMTEVCYSQKLRSIINIYSLTERCSKFTKLGSV
jgi:flagellum-specific peptidoglycan hydrolase FlgJ